MSAINKHLLSKLLVCRKLLNIKGKIEKTEFFALQELRSSAGESQVNRQPYIILWLKN